MFAGGGLVAGVGGMLALNHLRGLVPHSITENDLLIGDERLREAIELTNSTNRGTGTQRLIWSVPTNEKVMSLTFDDGPDPQFTPAVLEVLDRLEVKANFNIMGHNAERHDGLLAEVTGAGHEIGNHTLTHKDLAFQTREGTRREVESAKSVIDGLSGRTTTLFRPPRGVLTGEAANVSARLGYDVLLWTAMIARPPGTRPSVIRDYAATRFGTGHILALHDGIGAATFDRRSPLGRELIEKREAEIKVLPAIIEAALDDDFRFVTVSDLMSTGEQPGPGSHVPG
jgi:peptidoglycan/xylan/chitin deacetylase (PgdA/CDA1 family)